MRRSVFARGRPCLRVQLALALGCVSGGALAEPTAEEVAVAQQHYAEAREHQGYRNWVGCELSINQALRISETPGLRFHLAFCKEQQHRWVEALVDYRRAGELVASGVRADDVVELLPPATENLERLTPQLRLTLEEVPEGASLLVDGKALSAELIGVSFPVDPGTRRVQITAPGYTPYLQEVNLVPQDRRTLRVQLVKLAGKSRGAKSTLPQAEESSALSGLGLTLASEAILALGGLGVGVGFTARAASTERERDDKRDTLDDPTLCRPGTFAPGTLCAQISDLTDQAKRDQNIATVGYVASSAATLAFFITWLVWPSDDEPEVVALPTEGRDGAVLTWRGAF
jgi:PEGA domain